MPSKNTKEIKSDETASSKVKVVKKTEESSDEEVELKTKSSKKVEPKSKGSTKGKPKKEATDEESESDVESKSSKGKKNSEVETKSSKGSKKASEVDEHSDEDVEMDEEQSEQESETEEEKKPKKISFEDLTNKLQTLHNNIKEVEKEIKELEKQTETKQKMRRDYERQVIQINKVLLKTHKDEVTKALKSKPKRKGNVNGGFNKEQPVPEIIREFLELDEGICMARPKVMSALNNKFSQLGLKNGQVTTLDKSTAKALGLGKECDGKEIKFTEFQSFLASFYPKKEDKEIEA